MIAYRGRFQAESLATHFLLTAPIGMVLCLALDKTFMEPQYGQAMPSGQRVLMNHCSAVASSGNMRVMSRRERPVRKCLPGLSGLLLLLY